MSASCVSNTALRYPPRCMYAVGKHSKGLRTMGFDCKHRISDIARRTTRHNQRTILGTDGLQLTAVLYSNRHAHCGCCERHEGTCWVSAELCKWWSSDCCHECLLLAQDRPGSELHQLCSAATSLDTWTVPPPRGSWCTISRRLSHPPLWHWRSAPRQKTQHFPCWPRWSPTCKRAQSMVDWHRLPG